MPPVGVGEIVALKSTGTLIAEFSGAVTATDVAVRADWTLITLGADVDPETPDTPLYSAVTLWSPAVVNVCGSAAVPLTTATGPPIRLSPSLN